jgi:AcrR family transcriptional regulator
VVDGKGGYPVGDARRARILEVAAEEFAAHGYRSASIARVAAAAGLSQSGLLHHFRSKEELLIAVLERRDAADLAWLEQVEGGAYSLTALVRLVHHNMEVPGLVRLFAVLTSEALAPDHPAHEWARQRYAFLRAQFADHLRRGIESGELRPGIAVEEHADRLIAMMDGLQLQWLMDPDGVDMDAVFRGYIDDLYTLLRVPAALGHPVS